MKGCYEFNNVFQNQVLDADSPVNPRYGDIICWVSSKMALVVFFAIPLGLLLLINATLFVISAHNIAQARASARVLGRQEDLKMAIYIKLTLVMGLTWVLGFLAALVPDVKVINYTKLVVDNKYQTYQRFSFNFLFFLAGSVLYVSEDLVLSFLERAENLNTENY